MVHWKIFILHAHVLLLCHHNSELFSAWHIMCQMQFIIKQQLIINEIRWIKNICRWVNKQKREKILENWIKRCVCSIFMALIIEFQMISGSLVVHCIHLKKERFICRGVWCSIIFFSLLSLKMYFFSTIGWVYLTVKRLSIAITMQKHVYSSLIMISVWY